MRRKRLKSIIVFFALTAFLSIPLSSVLFGETTSKTEHSDKKCKGYFEKKPDEVCSGDLFDTEIECRWSVVTIEIVSRSEGCKVKASGWTCYDWKEDVEIGTVTCIWMGHFCTENTDLDTEEVTKCEESNIIKLPPMPHAQ